MRGLAALARCRHERETNSMPKLQRQPQEHRRACDSVRHLHRSPNGYANEMESEMNAQHTPGRLNVAVEIFDNDGMPETVIQGLGAAASVAVALDFGANNPCMREANARRLVACWNACEGISTDDIEAHSVNIIHKLHDDAAKRVLSERDELLEALLGCIAAIERTAHCTEADRFAAADKARAAIAKAGGAV